MPWTRIDFHPVCEQFQETQEQIERFKLRRCNHYGPDDKGKGWQIAVNEGWTRIYKGWWIITDDAGVRTMPDDMFHSLYKEVEPVAEVVGPPNTKDACYLPATVGQWQGFIHAARTGQAREGKFTQLHQFLDKFENHLDDAINGMETVAIESERQ